MPSHPDPLLLVLPPIWPALLSHQLMLSPLNGLDPLHDCVQSAQHLIPFHGLRFLHTRHSFQHERSLNRWTRMWSRDDLHQPRSTHTAPSHRRWGSEARKWGRRRPNLIPSVLTRCRWCASTPRREPSNGWIAKRYVEAEQTPGMSRFSIWYYSISFSLLQIWLIYASALTGPFYKKETLTDSLASTKPT